MVNTYGEYGKNTTKPIRSFINSFLYWQVNEHHKSTVVYNLVSITSFQNGNTCGILVVA